ncbi:MAG: DUF2177 family protein [Candidatus Magasanikbacteria bacterium]|nr:DUF2177 family protein [Candidatus Magasanikbacteria bacterium]
MFFKLYIAALPIFFALDMVWLGLISKNFYKEQIGFLIKPQVNWYAAIVFYLIFIAGLVAFVISPALEKNSWIHALLFGAFFGLVTYATYDLTNLAMTKDWPFLVTAVDLAWGMFLSAAVSISVYGIATKIGL